MVMYSVDYHDWDDKPFLMTGNDLTGFELACGCTLSIIAATGSLVIDPTHHNPERETERLERRREVTLREGAIEAMRLAADEAYEEGRGDGSVVIGAALDALLTYLTEQAEEWTYPLDWVEVSKLVAVLTEETQ
jgi:hypothetical protein